MKKSKLIASVVLFKELHDNNKDIYDIISEFLKSTIIVQKKWSFNSTEITTLLEDEFDFNLPEAVIKTTLKRRLLKTDFLNFENGEYHVKDINAKQNSEFEFNYQIKKNIYQETEEEFIVYVEKKLQEPLNHGEKEILKDNLKKYLLGNGVNEKYTKEISSFILKNKHNQEFTERLNHVKEGLVLYTGIRYTADLNELGKWNNELTIYLDTDILFYFAGFNGQIYQEIFNDFYSLVREINQSAKTKRIRLRYFEETEKEIFDFFHVATLIIERKTTLNPSKTAMKEIVNGCSTKSDIVVKRNKFFIDLQSAGIAKEENKNYYDNHEFVVEGNNVIDEIKKLSDGNRKEFDEEKCKNNLKIFTKINALRRGISNLGFDKSKYILLTGNKFVHHMAHSNIIKPNEKDIPFATDIDYVTDKFWFKLKKGFGKSDSKPKSFNIITKAQIVLSAQINNTVQEKFTALHDKYKSGEISQEEAISLNYELRESSLKPEEIDETNVEQSIAFINEFSIEEHKLELEKLKQRAKKGDEAQEELKRRDLAERTNKIKPIKSKCKNNCYAVVIAILSVNLILIYLSVKLILFLKEPGDTTIGLIGFGIGLIAMFPIYKISRKLMKYYTGKVKANYKKKINEIIKTSA